LTRQINYAGKIVEENEEKTQEIVKTLKLSKIHRKKIFRMFVN
jgi:hypothetical protein